MLINRYIYLRYLTVKIADPGFQLVESSTTTAKTEPTKTAATAGGNLSNNPDSGGITYLVWFALIVCSQNLLIHNKSC